MAGSDKKEQKLASSESALGGAEVLVVQDPDVSHFVMPGNPQEPDPRTSVKIEFLTFTLPEAEPLWTNPMGILWCNSLRWNAGQTTFGVEYKIPPSKLLKEGDEVKVSWNAYTDFDNPVLVPAATKEATFSNITKEQAENGIVWLIEPYVTHILPTYTKPAPIGKGEVTYTITGKPATQSPTNTEVGMFVGEGSCNIPPPPNP
ncbi:hypothetical protein JFU37_25590 [Pseudomonas sp. TH41]|uniref:hypothetical protein n=1 Tax=Pseudomonas sp. TH41 TaxID=2796405 RepID=UPI0019143E0D|nr:hypothetical protein [Pseudomonas sp. TH41]MBK5355860.1 hypothetical protein [Pseudomonas sp. TH41]